MDCLIIGQSIFCMKCNIYNEVIERQNRDYKKTTIIMLKTDEAHPFLCITVSLLTKAEMYFEKM